MKKFRDILESVDIAEEKQFVIKVPKGGPRGKDLLQKISGRDQKDAVAKFRKQHPRLKNDTIEVTPLAVMKKKGDRYVFSEEEKNCGCGQDPCITYGKVDEAMSERDKKKRLAMIKKAVEKINKSNAEKAKKDALAMMKASGMFDEDLDEAMVGDKVFFMQINIDYTETWPDLGGKKRSEQQEMDMEWDNDRAQLRSLLKRMNVFVADSSRPTVARKKVGILVLGTRGGDAVTKKVNERAVRALMRRADIMNVSDKAIKIFHVPEGMDRPTL